MRHEKEIRRWSKLQDGTSVWYKDLSPLDAIDYLKRENDVG